MGRTQELLIATHNAGKVREIKDVVSHLPLRLCYLEDFPDLRDVEENGNTYEENATIKALDYARQSGLWSLADDSGLEVQALGNAPGVYSARYAGFGASDADRITKLLNEPSLQWSMDRRAKFVCAMVLAGAQMKASDELPEILAVTQGICEGSIAAEPRGANGFGFDPVFVPSGYQATFAELPSEVKASISHRALALKAMRDVLERCLAPT
jgi:XTP/dITP diphosphohydrolase